MNMKTLNYLAEKKYAFVLGLKKFFPFPEKEKKEKPPVKVALPANRSPLKEWIEKTENFIYFSVVCELKKLKQFLFNKAPGKSEASSYKSFRELTAEAFVKEKVGKIDQYRVQLEKKVEKKEKEKNEQKEINILNQIKEILEPVTPARSDVASHKLQNALPCIDIENFPRLSACKLFFFSPLSFFKGNATGQFLRQTVLDIASYNSHKL